MSRSRTAAPCGEAAATLLDRLDAMPPRDAALLERALVERIPLPELLERQGVEPRALALSLWSAAQTFLGCSPAGASSEREAVALYAALEQDAPLPAQASALGALREHAEEILALIDARHRRNERWEGWVRATLAVALVFLALWMAR